MANKEQVEILRQGPDTWNKWRKVNPNAIIDLSGMGLFVNDVRGADLVGANLAGSGLMGHAPGVLLLTNSNLSGSNLAYADLGDPLWMKDSKQDSLSNRTALFQNADFSGSILDCTNLQNADLREADLSDTTLFRTNFHGADLSGANFSGARLNDIVLTRTNLTGAIGLETCKHLGPSSLDMQTLTMSGELPENFLRGCGVSEKLIEYLSSILNKALEYYSCFISYSHKDKSFAIRLHDQLQARGIRCWLDDHQILPGDDSYSKIDHGIRIWDKVLLCCSESSLASWWVNEEIHLAFDKERHLTRQRGKRIHILIPLNLDDSLYNGKYDSGKEILIQNRTPADFVGWEQDNIKFETQFDSVVKALRADFGSMETPPEPRL